MKQVYPTSHINWPAKTASKLFLKTILPLLTLLLTVQNIAVAQLKIGDNPTNISSASLLEMEGTNKGLVFPRVSLTALNSRSPLAADLLEGTTVYNTNTALPGGTGLYVWKGTTWVATSTSLPVLTTGSVAFSNGTSLSQNNSKFFWNNTNARLGIGTAAPGHPLTIQSPSSGGALIGFFNNLGTDKYNFSLTNGGLNLSESNVAAGRLFIKDGGNVGIGTVSPATSLDVVSTFKVSDGADPSRSISQLTGVSTYAASTVAQTFYMPSGTVISQVDVYCTTGGTGTFNILSGDVNGDILSTQTVAYNNSGVTSITLSTPVEITSNGTYCFSIIGSSFLPNVAGSSTNTYSGGNAYLATTPFTTGDLKFKIYYSVMSGISVYTAASGNVGMGTYLPSEKLVVNGNVKIYGTGNGLKFPDGTTQTTAAVSGTDNQTLSYNTASRILAISGTAASTVTFPAASSSQPGLLTSADWTTFNNKSNFSLPTLANGSVLFSNGTTLAQSNNSFFWDNANTRLGIGTNSPASLLDVRNGDGTARITVGSSTGTGGGLSFGNPSHGIQRGFPTINADNNVGFYTTAGNLYLSANGAATNQFILSNAGNVGIGTAAPSQKLEVAGNVQISGTGNGVKFADGTTQNTAATATTSSNGLTKTGDDIKLGGALTQATAISQGANNLTFEGTGKMGVGTATPIAQLDVANTFRVGTPATTTKIDQPQWTGFTNLSDLGQTFLLPAGAIITQIDVYYGAGTGTFKIFQGAPGGTLLMSQTITSSGSVTSIVLNTPLKVTTAGTYSFSSNIFGCPTSNLNPYGDGVAYQGTNVFVSYADLPFTVYYTLTPPSLYVSAAGSIGVGSIAPSEKLEVDGNIKITGSGNSLKFPDGTTQTTAATSGFTLPSLTSGSVLFSNGSTLAQNNSKLFWDNTNSRLGVGTASPVHPITIQATSGGAMLGFSKSDGSDKYNFSYTSGGLNLSESNVAGGRLFVKDGGNIGIGTTNPLAALHIDGTTGGLSSGLGVMISGGTADNPYIELRGSSKTPYIDFAESSNVDYTTRLLSSGGVLNVQRLTGSGILLNVGGGLQCVGAVNTSDERLKTNIRPLTGALASVTLLKGVRYQWNELGVKRGGDAGKEQIGVLAQEVEKIFPEFVSTGTDGYKAVNYAQMAAVLIEAVKEQQQEIEALKNQNETLKADHQAIIRLQDQMAKLQEANTTIGK